MDSLAPHWLLNDRYRSLVIKILGERAYLTIYIDDGVYTSRIVIRSCDEWMIDLVEIAVGGGYRHGWMSRHNFVYELRLTGRVVRDALTIMRTGEVQLPMVALLQEFEQTKRGGFKIKRTEKFRANRDRLMRQLNELSRAYADQMRPKLWSEQMIQHMEWRELNRLMNPTRTTRDDDEVRPKRRSKMEKRQEMLRQKREAIRVPDVIDGKEVVGYGELVKRVRLRYEIGDRMAKEMIKKSVDNLEIIKVGAMRSKSSGYSHPLVFEDLWVELQEKIKVKS